MNDEIIGSINFDNFQREGLYLIFQDGSGIDLSRENIEKTAEKYWQDENLLPDNIRTAAGFQRCPFCPGRGGICEAIRPVLPFLLILDRFTSIDRVTATYKGFKGKLLHISQTDMQNALKYVSNLSLIGYCLNGKKYRNYFKGIIPLMDTMEVAVRIYLSVFWSRRGELKEIEKTITQFKEELLTSTVNQQKRVALICRNDAFLNALVNTNLLGELLSFNFEKEMNEYYSQ